MKKQLSFLAILFFITFSGKSADVTNLSQKMTDPPLSKELGFEENRGQIKDLNGNAVQDVLFSAKLQDYTLYITTKGVSVVMYQNESLNYDENNIKFFLEENKAPTTKFARYDLNLTNANIDKNTIELKKPTKGITNYYINNTIATNVNSYQTVILKNVYAGIDWVWRIEKGVIHHEFVVQVGADPSLIQIEVKWADISLEDNGKSVKFSTPLGKMTDGPIFAYGNTSKNSIDIRYNKISNNQLTYNVSNYNKNEILVIDPPMVLEWATFYGGTNDADRAIDIKTDNSGNVFITGHTYSSDFPTVNPGGGAYFDGTFNGNPDVILMKFNTIGEIEWATYYGGSAFDLGEFMSIDDLGNVFVTGQTNSPNLPTLDPGNGAYFDDSTNGQADSFIMKLENNGTLLWATFFGGSSSDTGLAITKDNDNNIYVSGKTRSPNFPTLDPGNGAYFQSVLNGDGNTSFYDFYILKFTDNGELLWSTYYGGHFNDYANLIEVDDSGNIFVAGQTQSADMPTMDPGNGAYFDGTHNGGNDGDYDAFFIKLTNTEALEWATYYGGAEEDVPHAMTIDNNGDIYVTGESSSPDLTTIDPGNNAYYDGVFNNGIDAILLKFSNNGEALWATYFGGSSIEYGISILTDDSNNLFLFGSTFSTNFPTLNPNDGSYYNGQNAGLYDLFISSFNSDLSLVSSTYYGGSDWDFAQSSALDGFGNFYLTGSSISPDFPTLDAGNGAYFNGVHNGQGYHEIILLKFNVEVLGIEDNPLFNNVIIYPNPSAGSFNIDLGELRNVSIKVYDFLGREVYSQNNINASTYNFKLNASSGIYILKVGSGNNFKSYKLLLE